MVVVVVSGRFGCTCGGGWLPTTKSKKENIKLEVRVYKIDNKIEKRLTIKETTKSKESKDNELKKKRVKSGPQNITLIESQR